MPEYWYSALDPAGTVTEGRMTAASENALADCRAAITSANPAYRIERISEHNYLGTC